MKNNYFRIPLINSLKSILGFTILIISLNFNLNAQQLPECGSDVPFFILDLSITPDSTYTTPEIVRNGQCCGGAGNENYVSFYVTLHPSVAAVEIGILPGYADPGGSGFYNVISGGDLTTPGTCGPDIAGGSPTCIVGPGPHKITYHKPGKNKVKYYLKQIPQPIYPADDTTRVGCSLPLEIFGLNDITITSINSSTGNTTPGAFNGLLSCTTCDNPSFNPGIGTPAWIDYQFCGTQQASLVCGVFETCDTVRLYTVSKLQLSVVPNPADFCDGGSVLLTSTASGGDGNYTYQWFDSGNNVVSSVNTYSASTQDTYTAQVSDGLTTSTCPAKFVNVPVTVGFIPEVDAGPDQTVCASSPQTVLSGTVLNASGGVWSGGSGTYDPSADSLIIIYTPTSGEITAGSVEMILTSTGAGGGCPNDSDTMTIFFSDTVFANPSYPPIVCNGDMTTVSAGASGGTVPYSYSWSTGSSNPSIFTSAGTYSVTVFDVYGCSASAVVNVTEPSPIFLDMSSTNTSTDIACDGTATVVISVGDAPYSILWSNSETTLTASNLCYGIVTVDVTDSNGCLVTGSVVVNNPSCASFNVTASKTDLACYGDTTGTATAVAVGGTPGYSYSWNSMPVQTTATAVNLEAGTYTVTATDTNGCIDVASVTILQPTVLTNTMTSTDVTTIGGSDGTATANPAGGFPGYSYVWAPTPQITQTATNLTAGIYYVDITDANSCVKSDSIYINEPPCNDFLVSVNPSPVTCNGDDDGSAYIVIAYGTPPYSISWSSGETDVMSVSNLAPGTYTVTIIDASNCTTFKNFDITEPDVLSLGLVPTNVSCFGVGDGTIDLTVSGGSFPYSYDWTLGAVTIATHQDLVNLVPGTYSIEVTDENGCIAGSSTVITQPAKLMASYTYQDITCNGDGDGSVDVTVTGGTLPYSYSWTGPGGYNNTTQDISNLEAGLYQLQITDANGCILGTTIQAFINEPDSVILETFTVPCPVPSETFVTVTIDSISGGTGGNYQVSFDGGSTYLAAGVYSALLPIDSTYFVVAIDSNGCNSPDTLIITIDPAVEITAVVFDPCVAPGTTEINITVTPQGGDGGPYEVSTNGGSTFNSPGTYVLLLSIDDSYDIVIRDGKGCESLPWPIVLPAPFEDTIVLLSEVSCGGASDGSVNLTISGGTSPYSIAWTGPAGFNSTSEDLTGLFAGTYYVTITDDSNCVILDTIDVTTVDDITPPVITFCPGNQNESSDLGFCSHTHSGTSWDATATDNCVVASIEYSLSGATTGSGTSLNGVVFNVGTTAVTWTATDGSGNTDQCSFDVVISDNEDPSITSCGAAGTQNVNADPGVCSHTHSGTAWDASATDNCTVSTVTYSLSGATSGSGTSLAGVTFNLGTTTVTWTVTDSSGNTDDCNFDVIVTDNQNPTIVSCGAVGTQNEDTDPGSCSHTHSGTAWDATATDNCTVSTITYSLSGATTGSGTSLAGVDFNLGTTTVTWTITDGSGNIATCNFDVIVSDDQLPVVISCGASGNQNVTANFGTCTYTNSGNGWNASATDNCTVSSIVYSLTGATTGSGTTLNGVVFNLGTTTVTWTVTDGTGNIATCAFDVIVTDGQVPSMTSCGAIGNQNVITAPGVCSYTHPTNSWDATATDNCSISSIIYTLSGATTGSGTSLNGVSFNLGTTTVTWTVTDGSGNNSFCTFNVTVTDNQNPAITSCGAVGTQNVDTDPGVCSHTHPNTSWDASATDNCTVSSIVYTLTGATTGSGNSLAGVTFNLGTTTVTWTVTDGSGNFVTCNFNVIVTDNEDPTIVNCVANINANNDAGLCGANVTWTPPTLTDNCGGSMTSTHNSGDFFTVGTTQVTYTATDGSGNVSTCVFNVTVTDDELPALTCPADIASCDSMANFNTPVATDNCGIVSVTQTAGLPSGSFFPVGTTVVTFEALDVNGNTNTCSFNVTIHPTPVLSTVDTDVSCYLAADGSIDLTVIGGTGPFSYSWSNSATTEDIFDLVPGIYTVVVSDVFGCSASISDTITQPNLLVLAKDVTNVSCFSGSDGAIDLTISGGTLPYSFVWSNSATSEDLTGLSPGVYSVVVTDANGCQVFSTTTITQPDEINIVGVVTDATCGASNGSIQVLVTGGTTPYQYLWSNGSTNLNLTNVAAGMYTLSVTDDNGCTAIYTDSVGSASNLSAHLHLKDVRCYGESNGSALIDVESGNPPYTYQWSNTNGNGSITTFNDSLVAGDYWVTVTDAFGCQLTMNFTINQPDSLYIVLETFTSLGGFNISENGASDGWITAMVYGGTQPYDYQWSNGETTSELFNLPAESYQLTIIDENGCSVTEMIRLIEPLPLLMPEGLSPNGDGHNDFFVILGLEAYPNNNITIYNRWGNIIFNQDGYNNDWQGTNESGDQLPDGTYFAILSVDGIDPITGYVDLRRSR